MTIRKIRIISIFQEQETPACSVLTKRKEQAWFVYFFLSVYVDRKLTIKGTWQLQVRPAIGRISRAATSNHGMLASWSFKRFWSVTGAV